MDVVASSLDFWHPFFGLFVFASCSSRRAPGLAAVALGGVGRRCRLRLSASPSPLDTSYVGPDYPGAKPLFSGPVSDADTAVHELLLLVQPAAAADRRRVVGRPAPALERAAARAGALFVYTVAG